MSPRRGRRRLGAPAPRAAEDRQSGMVTAELALGLPTVVVATLLALGVVNGVVTQLRCTDAASVAARLAARGEDDAAVTAAVTATGPRSARVQVSRQDGLVTADVTATVRIPGPGRLLPGFVVHERVVAADERAAVP